LGHKYITSSIFRPFLTNCIIPFIDIHNTKNEKQFFEDACEMSCDEI